MTRRKIYDCFLYFQEFEILEIRLKYLYEYVDLFIIVEFNQTFSGKKKFFNLEKKIYKLKPYIDKIFYLKIDEFHNSFDELISFLNKKSDKVSALIKENLLAHRHYNRNEINWVIDTYQRESIYYALERHDVQENDIIIISDIDEIPHYQILEDSKNKFPYGIISFKQNAFSFFFNLLSSKNWYGSIIASWSKLNYQSLNLLRLDVRDKFKIVEIIPYLNGGYHFTSIGSPEYIRNKIRNMGHQELNNKLILSRVEKNIYAGRDIFGRSIGQKYELVDIKDQNFFDLRMAKILNDKYKNLLITKLLNINILFEIYFFIGVKLLKLIHIIKVKLGLNKKI